MSDTKKYITGLLTQHNFTLAGKKAALLEKFVATAENVQSVKTIQELQQRIMRDWKINARLIEIMDTHLIIPNATVNKPYEATLDLVKAGLNDIIYMEMQDLSTFGLAFDNETKKITGTPVKSGDFKISLQFRIEGEKEEAELHTKQLSLIINADPRSLWKNIPSTETPDNYWKPDEAADFQPLGNRHIVVASKRGRSHANVGSFRDDDYAFKQYDNTGWSIVCVADGAGSATLSREGSRLACKAVIDYFAEHFTPESLQEFDLVLANHHTTATDETNTQISHFVYNNLSKAALYAHKTIQNFAIAIEKPLKEFHSTLIFALYKKYDFGCAILSFGVGDCPIGLLDKEQSAIKLMNWLDVGEFGGGTRFITMPEIFNSEKFTSRFGFKLVDDFSFLVLMTDGIYDPKFVVEANLEKIDKWKEFLADLGGNNEEKVTVEFSAANEAVASQLTAWMDFWSPGNHDDRTLAIIF